MSNQRWCLLYALCIAILHLAAGYNLDLGSFVRHTGNPGSMFGFSIAVHKYNASNWIIVGAPRENTSAYQQGVQNAGAVLKCGMNEARNCTIVPFDSKGNQINGGGEQIDTKSNQWLGATVTSGGENGLIVACAPRYVYHSTNPKRNERNEPVGTCFTSKDFNSFAEFSPCRTGGAGYHKQGSCQAGFSAAVSKKESRLFIGAPGSWYWQGQAYSINPDVRYPYKPPMYEPFGTGGQIYSYGIMDEKSKVFATGESHQNDDDSYMGYSMATGDFDGDGEDDVAIGMPRGSELLGRVILYKWNMSRILNMTGLQIGAYFGYSMCSVDVNGDKLDDLIIGAPMYSQPNNEGKYEVGRIYIMLQNRNGKFVDTYRDGFTSKGRFGLSLSTLGDVNQDGYGDFAVGAPYGGPNGRGAVYIFHGSQQGTLEKHSQVIYAEDVVGVPVPKTFGFSLSGGIDLDGNLYPDLAVGAYDSDTLLVFKARPVAVVEASTSFTSSSKLINLEEKNCKTIKYGKQVTCTKVVSCLKYRGTELPTFLEFQVSWLLDARKTRNPRMFFLHDEGKNIRNTTYRLERGKEMCLKEQVYVVDNVRDKLTPLEVEMRYQLRGSEIKPTTRSKRAVLEPVIDQNREIVQKDSINIQKNCGSDNICVPDLRLEIKTVDKFLLGSREPLHVDVLISNNGEDAFEAGFYMTLPKYLDFKKIHESDSRDTPITCTAPTANTNYTLKCDIGNPLPAKKVAKFTVVMTPSQKEGMASSYEIYMEANSTNQEHANSQFDNKIKKSIGIWVETDLVIVGTSLPDFEHYKASDYLPIGNSTKETDLGPQVVHIYNIRNNGPSSIEEAVVYIHYPNETHAGDTLMYLLNQPETDGSIYCDPSINVNPRNLKLDPTLSNRSYLKAIGVAKSSGSSSGYANRKYHVEQSAGDRFNTVANGATVKYMTEEQRKKLADDDNIESPGDASYVHSQRAKEAALIGAAGHGQHHTFSSTWNSSGDNPNVVYSSKNSTFTYGANGKPVVESSSTYSHNGYNNPNSERSGSYVSSEVLPTYTHGGRVVSHGNANARSGSFSDLGRANLGKDRQSGGLRTNFLDLGSLNRNRVDDEIRNRAEGHGRQYHHSTGGSSGNTEYHATNQGNFDGIYDDGDGNYYDDDGSQFAVSSQNQDRLGRPKRAIEGEELESDVRCRATKCAIIRCVVKNLNNNDDTWIAIRTRLVAETLEKLAPNVALNVSTMAVSHVTKLPYIGTPKDKIIKSHEIFYKAVPEPVPVPDVVPLWVVVLSACVGAIILLLLVFFLYKCGFFNRNRPMDSSQERQPLRNGYHGDEHL